MNKYINICTYIYIFFFPTHYAASTKKPNAVRLKKAQNFIEKACTKVEPAWLVSFAWASVRKDLQV